MQPESAPLIVDIREPPGSELAGLADVLIGALGIAGVVTLMAVLAGSVLGAFMYWRRSREP